MKHEPWASWEKLFLHDVCKTMTLPLIAEKLERTERAVSTQATRIGAHLPSRMTGRQWTAAETFLIGRFSDQEIATATGRSVISVRNKRKSMTRRSGGKSMREWTTEELALLWRHTNAEVAEITGRTIEEVGDKRLQTNNERNGWDVNDPEREDV